MARININDSGKYGVNGSSEFFMLKDDGDTARVRFLYEEPDGSDIDYFLVHEMEIDGKKRYVSCTAVDDEGRMHRDDCPLCKAGVRTQEKLFLQLYDEDEEKIKVWERGKNFVGKIVSYLNRFGALVSRPIEIERRGKKGDQKTTYELFAMNEDNKTLKDFPEKRELEGTLIIQATKQDMIDMLDGVYKTEGSHSIEHEEPLRREHLSRREPRETRRRTREAFDTEAF